jgi:hypothetical protein
LPPRVEGDADNVALASISACSRIWSAPVLRACAAKRLVQAVSGVLNDKATAMRVFSLSRKPSAARSGLAVSTLIRKVSGLRRYPPGRFVREAATTNAGPLAGMWRCMSPHVFAAVMARSRRLLSAWRPMAPSMVIH